MKHIYIYIRKTWGGEEREWIQSEKKIYIYTFIIFIYKYNK